MNKKIFSLILIFFIGSTGILSASPGRYGSMIYFYGQVVDIDIAPMMTDGDGILTVRDEDDNNYTILVPAMHDFLPLKSIKDFWSLMPGHVVLIVGELDKGNTNAIRLLRSNHMVTLVE